MDTASVLSSYMSSSINTNYNSSTSSAQNTSTETDKVSMGYDTYESTSASRSDIYYTYTNTANISEKSEVSADDSEALTQSKNTPKATDAEGDSSEKESETKVEVKTINGQVYMTITTTNEDGTVSIRRINLSGNNIFNKAGNSSQTDDSLAEAVTM
jgi:hypothetical protein